MAKKELHVKTAPFHVVGLKQVMREIDGGLSVTVYLAKDADEPIRKKVLDRCAERGIPVRYVQSMKELGQMAGIEVRAAVAAEAAETAE